MIFFKKREALNSKTVLIALIEESVSQSLSLSSLTYSGGRLCPPPCLTALVCSARPDLHSALLRDLTVVDDMAASLVSANSKKKKNK